MMMLARTVRRRLLHALERKLSTARAEWTGAVWGRCGRNHDGTKVLRAGRAATAAFDALTLVKGLDADYRDGAR